MKMSNWQHPGRQLDAEHAAACTQYLRLEAELARVAAERDSIYDHLSTRNLHAANLRTLAANDSLPSTYATGTVDMLPIGTQHCIEGGCASCRIPGEDCPGNNAELREIVCRLLDAPLSDTEHPEDGINCNRED